MSKAVVDQSRRSKSVDVSRDWEIYDDRLRFAVLDALRLDDLFSKENVTDAWVLCFGVGAGVLADSNRFAEGPVSDKGLILDRGTDWTVLRIIRHVSM